MPSRSESGGKRDVSTHGARGSGSCAVECVLAEIGVDYEPRELSLRDDKQQGEQYAAINPRCKVPSLVLDDGPPLSGSVAILLTLDDHHPEAALLPATRISQCAPTARNTSGGRIHPDSCRFDLVADRRSCRVAVITGPRRLRRQWQ